MCVVSLMAHLYMGILYPLCIYIVGGYPIKFGLICWLFCQVLFSHAVLYLQSGSNSNAPELERDFPGVRSWLMHVSIITHVLNQ